MAFCFFLVFPPPSSPIFLHFRVCVCVSSLTTSYFCVSLSPLFVSYHPSILLADLNPVLFWSSALGETNSLWLSAATHILFCPSALTVSMRKRLREGGGRGLKKDNKRDGEEEKCKEHCEIHGIKHFDG